MRRSEKQGILEAGLLYVAARDKAAQTEADRKNAGNIVLDMLKKFRMRKVAGDIKNGYHIEVGYGSRTTIKVEPMLYPILREHGLLERVTTTEIDQEKLAALINSGELTEDVLHQILANITQKVTKYPVVRTKETVVDSVDGAGTKSRITQPL